jgi:tetratricopeptide (TPR) repeat protein
MQREIKKTIILVLLISIGLLSIVVLQRRIDSSQIEDLSAKTEELYLSGERAKSISPSVFHGLIADWYWLKTLQYMGRKMLAHKEELQLDDLSPLHLKLLYSMLDTTTTLDPQFIAVYEFGAIVLPAIDKEDAVKLIKKGIENNPNEWKLYHQLGYIYWQSGNYLSASKAYAEGAKIPNAPKWIEAMAARMEAEGGNRNFAREIYTRMYEQATDDKIKEMAFKRLLQLRSLDERDLINRLLTAYQEQRNECPANWSEVAKNLQKLGFQTDKTGAPLDPAGVPYQLKEGCTADLNYTSPVPYK